MDYLPGPWSLDHEADDSASSHANDGGQVCGTQSRNQRKRRDPANDPSDWQRIGCLPCDPLTDQILWKERGRDVGQVGAERITINRSASGRNEDGPPHDARPRRDGYCGPADQDYGIGGLRSRTDRRITIRPRSVISRNVAGQSRSACLAPDTTLGGWRQSADELARHRQDGEHGLGRLQGGMQVRAFQSYDRPSSPTRFQGCVIINGRALNEAGRNMVPARKFDRIVEPIDRQSW